MKEFTKDYYQETAHDVYITKRNESSNNRRDKVRYMKFNLVIIATILIVNLVVIGSTLLSNAQESEDIEYVTHYISLEINSGDTLWNIAEEYKSSPAISTKDAVKEIKELNNLSSENIYAGQYVIVPSYSLM